MSKTEKEKMLAGELYRPDAQIAAEQAMTKAWLERYNAALAAPVAFRSMVLYPAWRVIVPSMLMFPI